MLSRMTSSHFSDRLTAAVRRVGNPVLVGLDPRRESLPPGLVAGEGFEATARAYATFCRGVIDVVAPLVAAVKPQAAFFEQLGPAGGIALKEVISYASRQGLLVILDGKRNDIGSTAEGYARRSWDRATAAPGAADALTVSPYLGDDSLQPFFDVALARGAGIFVLVKTSNPGGKRFQDLVADGQAHLPTRGGICRGAGPAIGRRTALRFCRRGRGSHLPGPTGRAAAGDAACLALDTGLWNARGNGQDCAAAFDCSGPRRDRQQLARNHFCPQPARPTPNEFGASRWQEAVEAATRDMIAELGRIRRLAS